MTSIILNKYNLLKMKLLIKLKNKKYALSFLIKCIEIELYN